MAMRRSLQYLLLVLGIVVVSLGANIRFPRKNILSLETLKNAGNTWYEFYYAAPIDETEVYFNVDWEFTWMNTDQLRLSYAGIFDGNCDSGSYPHLTAIKPDKAAFLDGSGVYYAFFSSDPSQYLFLFECHSSGAMPDSRLCPPDKMVATFMVKNQHPDSLPLDKALNDLKRNTNKALAFDSSVSTTTGFPLKFFFTMVGENNGLLVKPILVAPVKSPYLKTLKIF